MKWGGAVVKYIEIKVFLLTLNFQTRQIIKKKTCFIPKDFLEILKSKINSVI